jgi:hypothetical protein
LIRQAQRWLGAGRAGSVRSARRSSAARGSRHKTASRARSWAEVSGERDNLRGNEDELAPASLPAWRRAPRRPGQTGWMREGERRPEVWGCGSGTPACFRPPPPSGRVLRSTVTPPIPNGAHPTELSFATVLSFMARYKLSLNDSPYFASFPCATTEHL